MENEKDVVRSLMIEIARLKKDYANVSNLLHHYAQSNTELSRAISALEQQNYELRKQIFATFESLNQQLDDLEGLKDQLGDKQ